MSLYTEFASELLAIAFTHNVIFLLVFFPCTCRYTAAKSSTDKWLSNSVQNSAKSVAAFDEDGSPTCLMHPVLVEKLRVGVSGVGNRQLSTVNFWQSEQSIRDQFYDLQDRSPFPKLPPYCTCEAQFCASHLDERDNRTFDHLSKDKGSSLHEGQ